MNKLGCDVSQWQDMDWKKARLAGIQFAFIKCTEGTTWVDPHFAAHWKGAKEAGIERGAYHFFRNSLNAVQQADHFVKTLNGDYGELHLVVDVEDKGTVALTAARIMAAVGAATATVETAVRIFIKRVVELTGKPVMVYTSPSYIQAYFKDPAWSQVPLWLANYISTAPSVPAPWHPDRIHYWQFRVDLNGEYYGVVQPAGAPKVKIDLDIGYF
jgi:lysozyme